MASPSPAEQGPLRPWPTLRALFIALVLLVHGSIGGPWPDIGRSDLRYGVAKDELRRWSGILSDLGWALSPAELADELVAVGQRSRELQRQLYGPVRPLLKLTGTGQAWALFAFPDPYAGRLVISTRRAGETGFTPLYRAPGEGPEWLVDLVEYRRIRGIYDDKGDRSKPGYAWGRICTYLAARVMAADPQVDEVELRLDLVTLPVPGQREERPPDKRRHVRTRTRVELEHQLELLGAPLGSTVGPSVGLPASPAQSPVGP